MELLLRNLDKDLSEEGVEKELLPFMNSLGVAEWDCHKPRRATKAKISFLREYDGERFLARHGARLAESRAQPRGYAPEGRVRDIPGLYLLHKPIFVYKSRDPVDKALLDHLRHRRDEAADKPTDEPLKKSFAFSVTEVACGHNMFLSNGQTPTFIQQTVIQTDARATIGQRFLVTIFLDHSRMHIGNAAVISWIVSNVRSTLTLVLSEAPRFYKQVGQSRLHGAPFDNANNSFERCLSLPFWEPHSKYVAGCLVYQLSLKPERLNGLAAKLRSTESISCTQWHLPVKTSPVPWEEDYTTACRRFESLLNATERTNTVPYAIRFLVHRLVSNSYVHPFTAHKVLVNMEAIFAQFRHGHIPITAESMKYLFNSIPFACPGEDSSQLDADVLLQEILQTEKGLRDNGSSPHDVHGTRLPDNQFWVFRAMVTPTNIRLEGPESGSKNRVMRRFASKTEFFLRVLFCDEDGQSPEFIPNISNKAVFDRYRSIFQQGIRVAGRQFSFLGFSHSSLRSHAAWFCAPFKDDNHCFQNHDTILKELGNFAKIRVPALCAARIGQAFSETPFAVPLSECGIRVGFIPDIKSADGSRIFSDGIGTMSSDALAEIRRFLPKAAAGSTCLQIRLGGVKGMLALDATLSGKIICVRKESMMKFDSGGMDELGICDMASRSLRMYLNRQLIKIMEDMGSDTGWFEDQLHQAVDTLRDVLKTPSKVGRFVASQGIGTPMAFPWFMKQLHRMHIDFRRDSFLRSVVEHAVLRELRLLKYQAKIPIEQGVMLFGVMDEYGYLQPNEIYVAFDEPEESSSSARRSCPRQGPVLVTRCPALHPGDVRIVQHITPPADHPLRALRNCIVFSQKGQRGLPSQLSGGDLDGDLYNVIWDPRALQARNFEAADYPRVVSKELDRDVTQEDIADFFVKFMETDILGVIAVRHQVVADIEVLGTRAPACIKLAEMHSVAVDYSKSGKPVKLTQLGKSPRARPDFLAPAPPVQLHESAEEDTSLKFFSEEDGDEEGLGRPKTRYYRSEKILGRLYRAVEEKRIWHKGLMTKDMLSGPSVWSQLQTWVKDRITSSGIRLSYQSRVDDALKIRTLYDQALEDVMVQFSESARKSLSEQEVFCGSIFNKKGRQTRRQRDASKELREEMDRISAWIVRLIRGRDRSKGGGGDDDNYYEWRLGNEMDGKEGEENEDRQVLDGIELSWACLVVGNQQHKTTGRRQHESRSFAVIAACCLLRLLNEASKPGSLGLNFWGGM